MTANRALRELTADGFLSRVPGVGTFVKEPPARSSLHGTAQHRRGDRRSAAIAYAAHIEQRGTVAATPALAEEFEMKLPARLFHLVIVHDENGLPVQLEERHVNPFTAPRFPRSGFRKR